MLAETTPIGVHHFAAHPHTCLLPLSPLPSLPCSCTSTTPRPLTPGATSCAACPTRCCGCCGSRPMGSRASRRQQRRAASTPRESSLLMSPTSRCTFGGRGWRTCSWTHRSATRTLQVRWCCLPAPLVPAVLPVCCLASLLSCLPACYLPPQLAQSKAATARAFPGRLIAVAAAIA